MALNLASIHRSTTCTLFCSLLPHLVYLPHQGFLVLFTLGAAELAEARIAAMMP